MDEIRNREGRKRKGSHNYYYHHGVVKNHVFCMEYSFAAKHVVVGCSHMLVKRFNFIIFFFGKLYDPWSRAEQGGRNNS